MEQGELYRGFGNGLARAFELVLTPAIFGLLGWVIDRWVGTSPLFTLVLGLIGVVGTLLRTWYAYEHEMKILEASGPWARVQAPAPMSEQPATPSRPEPSV